MWTAFGWVCFGMAIWGLCILMQALQQRFAPELGHASEMDGDSQSVRTHHQRRQAGGQDARDREIAELRARIETLEAIVTDRRYQWEQELRRGSP
jgi:hypothetical protein